MRRAVIGTLAACGLLAAGCRPFGGHSSSDPTPRPSLSGPDVEKTINDKLPPQLHGVKHAGQAHCPRSISFGSNGQSVDCTMRADGQSVRIRVQPDGHGYKVSLDQAVLSVAALEADLARSYHHQFRFDCGALGVRVVDAGDTIGCHGTPARGGHTKLFDVTIEDTSGKYRSDVHTS